jgi:hypothetical protein
MHPVIRTVLLATAAAAVAAAAAGGTATAREEATAKPIVTVTRRGGLCLARTACKQVLRITDTTVAGEGLVPRRLRPAERTALLRAIAALNVTSLRPFRGTCSIAYDVPESVYRFRGVARALPECTYDLKRVKAVQLTDRLLGTLRPKPRS